jgi:hypothetical protein
MNPLRKADLIGLLSIGIAATALGWVTGNTELAASVGVSCSAAVMVADWLSRRRQRKLLRQMAEVAELASGFSATAPTAARLRETVVEAQRRLG